MALCGLQTSHLVNSQSIRNLKFKFCQFVHPLEKVGVDDVPLKLEDEDGEENKDKTVIEGEEKPKVIVEEPIPAENNDEGTILEL